MSGKWVNVSAGPRQVKDFNAAVAKLRGEGKTHTELYGIIGQTERSSALMSMCGPVRPEVIALDDEITAKHDGKVTRENVRSIIADYEAALVTARESRPVEDNRITPEVAAERSDAQAAQAAEWQAERDAEKAVLDQVMAKAPAAAKGLVYAEYQVDKSDPMTDYFNAATVRTVAIGWRMTAREDFRALHAAAAQFSETAEIEFSEHRENYSMGGGNYLSSGGRYSTGWIIRSRVFPCTYLQLTEDAIPEQASGGPGFFDQHGSWVPQDPRPNGIRPPQPDDGPVTVCPSSIGREGVVEVHFAAKPAADVLAGLKSHGFRWAKANRCWYGRDVAYAESLASA